MVKNKKVRTMVVKERKLGRGGTGAAKREAERKTRVLLTGQRRLWESRRTWRLTKESQCRIAAGAVGGGGPPINC